MNKMIHSPGYLYYVSEGKISNETSCNVLIVFFFQQKITYFWSILLSSLLLIIYAQNVSILKLNLYLYVLYIK